jgi:8-oxo-dGTP pyrophosphatase MutT (NUDIX family)
MVMRSITLNDVRAALALDPFDVDAARQRMAPRPRGRRFPRPPGGARPAGVLVLLYPVAPQSDQLALVLMRRTDRVNDAHRGQVSFPGGQHEEGETLVETALREANEELGVDPDAVERLGALATLYTPSAFDIYPTVGYTPARPAWRPQVTEVARVFEMTVAQLVDDATKVVEDWQYNGHALTVPFYRVQGETVWGATAMMLAEFEGRLRAVLGA